MFERFTDEARQTVIAAADEAHQLGHDFIGTEHQLLGILRVQHGLAYEVLDAAGVPYDDVRRTVMVMLALAVDDDALAAIGIDADKVRAAAEASFGPGASNGPPVGIAMASEVRNAFNRAGQEGPRGLTA